MIFLQPLALAAIPLIAIPFIIHWLNHRRHKPMYWAATHFLKQAQKQNRGIAKLRYWLLLALRTLAIAAIVLLLSRPLQTGYLASWTGSPATTIIVLDLSPSMQARSASGTTSVAEQTIDKLDQLRLSDLQKGKRIVFTQPSVEPLILPDEISISQSMASFEQAATTDIPATVSAALRWASTNVSGPVDLWVCSDLRESDWQSKSGRWKEIVEQLEKLPAVRLNILASDYSSASSNTSVTVNRVVRRQGDNRAELVFDLSVHQMSGEVTSRILLLTFEIAGVRSTVELELTGRESSLSGVVVPIDAQIESGFGVVSLPADSNPADNQYRFVFAKPLPIQATVVADDAAVGEVLQLALDRPVSENAPVTVSVFSPAEVSQIDWPNTALVAWQSELPTGDVAAKLNQVVDRGGSVIFLPPSQLDNESGATNDAKIAMPGADSLVNASPFKARWDQWQQMPEGSLPWQVADWRSDSDLLGNTAAGEPIPVSDWKIQKFCNVETTDAIPLAKLPGGEPLLTRLATEHGGLYFLTTLPDEIYSNLVEEGVSLYVLMQRALDASLSSTGNARCLPAGGDIPNDLADWKRLDDSGQTILDNQRALCSAVYELDSKLIAINRPSAEDSLETVSEETLKQLLGTTEFRVIQDVGSNDRALASEIWRWFAAVLVVSLLVEAWMTMPRANQTNLATRSSSSSKLMTVSSDRTENPSVMEGSTIKSAAEFSYRRQVSRS